MCFSSSSIYLAVKFCDLLLLFFCAFFSLYSFIYLFCLPVRLCNPAQSSPSSARSPNHGNMLNSPQQQQKCTEYESSGQPFLEFKKAAAAATKYNGQYFVEVKLSTRNNSSSSCRASETREHFNTSLIGFFPPTAAHQWQKNKRKLIFSCFFCVFLKRMKKKGSYSIYIQIFLFSPRMGIINANIMRIKSPTMFLLLPDDDDLPAS
jgi:hypothetical protein